MSWWKLTPEIIAEEYFSERYPSPALRAFLSVNLNDRPPEEEERNPICYPDCIEDAMQAFLQRWGGLETQIFLQVLKEGTGSDRLLAIFALGYSDFSQAAEVLAPFLDSPHQLERCAAAYMLAMRRDPRAISRFEEYLLEEPALDQYGRFVANAHEWYWIGRAYIARALATWGPPTLTPVLREAWLRQWQIEQQQGRSFIWPVLHHTLLYALGSRGAMGALHAVALPPSRQRLTMVLLALGFLHADDTIEYIPDALTYNQDFQQEVARVISDHFGLSFEESLRAVTSFSVDKLELMSLYEAGLSEELDSAMAHTIDVATKLTDQKMWEDEVS
jgi:hypothetical protein